MRIAAALERIGISTPSRNPPAGTFLEYYKSDGLLYRKDSNGTETLVGGGGSALAAYPVGAVYLSDRATSPATLFGGTWARFGEGRMIVGVNEADADFDTPLSTGGSKTTTIAAANLPQHTHDFSHVHGVSTTAGATGSASSQLARGTVTESGITTAPFQNSNPARNTDGGPGSSTPMRTLDPYVTVYMWRRTA